MLIKRLDNPITEQYAQVKNKILSCKFPWYTAQTSLRTGGIPFFVHTVLRRPDEEFPVPIKFTDTEIFDSLVFSLRDILKFNSIKISTFLRISVNCTFHVSDGPACPPHHDHDFPHKNLLIYLTQSSGATVVINPENGEEESFNPIDDAVILFEGEHYHYQPNVGERRLALIATFI